jgi:hypothetical protein
MAEPLVSLEEFTRRAPEAVKDPDGALAALDDASALVRAEAGLTWEDSEPPGVVLTIVISAALRAVMNPEGVSSLSVGTFSVSYANASPGVYLTQAERSALRRALGHSGVWALRTTRGRIETASVLDEM